MGSPTCPTCKGPLREVRNTSAYLNDDQASSQRAGDFYCEKCPPNGRSNANRWCYWWAREVTTPSAPADDARPMVTGGGLIKFDRRADDASGAEAAACVATAHDMAPRVVVEPYGRSEWRVWLHIGSASWAVGDPRHTKDAAERFAEPLRHALRAPLPATDDAVEEARKTVVANAKAWVARPVAGRGAYKATAALEESIEALLAAESDAALRRASARRARREASVSSVPMPRDLSEEAVAKWLHNIAAGSNPGMQVALRARAVRALLREKVRLAADVAYDLLAAPWDPAEETAEQYGTRHAEKHDAIVSRVLGEEAPRG